MEAKNIFLKLKNTRIDLSKMSVYRLSDSTDPKLNPVIWFVVDGVELPVYFEDREKAEKVVEGLDRLLEFSNWNLP